MWPYVSMKDNEIYLCLRVSTFIINYLSQRHIIYHLMQCSNSTVASLSHLYIHIQQLNILKGGMSYFVLQSSVTFHYSQHIDIEKQASPCCHSRHIRHSHFIQNYNVIQLTLFADAM
jgi:hypothetical protein